jgi:thymidylate synthase
MASVHVYVLSTWACSEILKIKKSPCWRLVDFMVIRVPMPTTNRVH